MIGYAAADSVPVRSTPEGLPVVFGMVWVASVLAGILCALASIVSVVRRFRRSSGVERQRMKWFVAGGVATAAGVFATTGPGGSGVRDAIVLATLLALPAAICVAVFRYRLYEIDRLINRTVTYGLLTALLAGLYAAAVVTSQALLAPLTTDDQWGVAAATLAVAAAFGPVRRRVQSGVDRRFNRARYDAVRTVETFNAQLRDEVDLDSLADQLQMVAASTVQPAHVSVWSRPTEAPP